MRPSGILDTGPLVAYLRPQEAFHEWSVDQFSTLDPPLVTCEPVIAEACFLAARGGRPASRVLELFERGAVRIGFELNDELAAVRALMQRYSSVPMSLADACLVRLAELTGLPICTLDADFTIYRAHGRRPLQLISPGPRHLHEP